MSEFPPIHRRPAYPLTQTVTITPNIHITRRCSEIRDSPLTSSQVSDNVRLSVHISSLGFDNAEWRLRFCLAQLEYRKKTYEESCIAVGDDCVIEVECTTAQTSSTKEPNPRMCFYAKVGSSGTPLPDCHVEVPRGEIKKVLNKAPPQLLYTPRPIVAQPKKRMKISSRYDFDGLSLRPSTPTLLFSAASLGRRSKPFGQTPPQLIAKNSVYIPTRLSRRDSGMATDSESEYSTSSGSSIATFRAIVRTSSNIAHAPIHISSAIWRRMHSTPAGEEWDSEAYYDIHGRTWTDAVAAASTQELNEQV
jgi:hypothetical protein